MNEIILKDPSDLSIHPLAKTMPEWPKDDPRFASLVEDIRDRGIDKPLLIDKENRIVDGRMLWRAAKQLQLAQVACKIVPDDLIASSIVNSLLQRRHLTKSARVYLVYPLLKPVFEAAKQKRVENLKKGNVSPNAVPYGIRETAQAYAELFGIDRQLFIDAGKVHEYFAKDANFKAQMKPRILAEPIGGEHENKRPMGLGAVIAGWAGRNSTLDQARADRQQLDLFTDGLGTLTKRLSYWEKFSKEQRLEAREAIRNTVAAMPTELRMEWVNAIKESNKDAK